MDSAMGRRARLRMVLVPLLAGAAWMPFHGLACTTYPPIVDPPISTLVPDSDLIARVRIDRVLPMSAEDVAFTERAMSGAYPDVPIHLPSNSAQVTLVQALKGEWPTAARVSSGPTSCDVVLLEGREYIVFADAPSSSGAEIVPLRGTFAVSGHASSVAALTEVEHSLHLSNSTTP